MYKKLLLSVAVMVSYNATTLSMEEGSSLLMKNTEEVSKSSSRLWSATKGCLSDALKSGIISLVGSCMLAKEMPSNKEALMPHVYFAGITTAAGGAFSILNRFSKYLTGTYSNLSLDLVRHGGLNTYFTQIPMTHIPIRISITSIAGILATAAYYKRYA